jgi:hypothetical protein
MSRRQSNSFLWHKICVLQLDQMELRNHPLMSFHDVSIWPPVWVWIDGHEDKHPKGEVGLLKEVKVVNGHPTIYRCFLWMKYQDGTYVGCLLFSDGAFCEQVRKLLQENIGRPIEFIGGLDPSYPSHVSK